MFGKSEHHRDYQHTARPLVAMARQLDQGEYTPPHRHRRGQLIYAAQGVLTVEATEGLWVVPPQRAVWIPPETCHGLRATGRTQLQSLYVEPGHAAHLPERCVVLAVSPLLRALLGEAVGLPTDYPADSRSARLMALLLESIAFDPLPALDLPMPRDPRALRLAQQLRATPGRQHGLPALQDTLGASRRTLERLFMAETGLSLGRWRQQAMLLHALQRLAEGQAVAAIAQELGYAEVAAFSAMFRQALGVPPSRYFTRVDASPPLSTADMPATD